MCSDGGAIWPSAVIRVSPAPATAPTTIRVALGSRRSRPTAASAGCRSASLSRASSGMVTNTLPSPWPSETRMSGAYSTERIRTRKYCGSSAAATAPTNAPFGA